jgi:cytochrome P450
MLDGPQEVDFAKDVAADLPLLTLADVLGVPREDRGLLFDWSNRVIGWQDADYAVSADFDPERGSDLARQVAPLRPRPGPDGLMPDPRSRAGMPDLYAYAHLLGARRRESPGDDVMSLVMAQRDDDGARVSIEEFENLFWLFAVAGNETLRNGIPGAMVALVTHPEAQRALRDDPTMTDTAVEELLRWWTPVMTFRRTATRPTEVAGQSIAAGDKVVVSFVAANRDPAAYGSDADTVDLRRLERRGTPSHLSFGHGPHFCLGAHLARVQMRELLTAVLAATSSIEPAGDPALLRSNFQRGVKRLPVRWSPA